MWRQLHTTIVHVPRHWWAVGIFFSIWVAYCGWFWWGVLSIDQYGSLISGHVNVWGDWAVHFTMTMALAERGIGIASPLIVGQPFSYPFVINLLSALLFRSGIGLIPAMVFPSFIASVFFGAMVLCFYRFFSRSWAVAMVASIIFFCNGGLGFLYFVRDVALSTDRVAVLLNPPHEYTRIDDVNIKWISIIDSMMVPQRAFTLGFPLGLLTLVLAWFGTREERRWGTLVAASGVAGVMPIVHTHTFLALFVIFACWSSADIVLAKTPTKRLQVALRWGVFALLTSILALPLWLHFFQRNTGNGFVQWYPGWLAKEYDTNWAWFWLLNWGITPFMVILAAFTWLRQQPRRRWAQSVYAFPFFLLWVLINLFIFQPWPWDNTKLFVWAWVGMAGVIGWGVVTLWQQTTRPWWHTVLRRGILLVASFVLVASGALDAYRVLRHDLHAYESYSREELLAADWVREHTAKDSLWLTPHPHNHWLFNLTGRQTVMAYPGWLWTQGYDFQTIGRDVEMMYGAGDPEIIEQLFNKYGVRYVTVGPLGKQDVPTDENYFSERFPVIYQSEGIRIYEVPTLQ